MGSSTGEITQILSELGAGDDSAADRLWPLVYDELRALAGRGEVLRVHQGVGVFLAERAAAPVNHAALGEEHTRTRGAIKAIVAAYERWDRPDAAAEWQAKLPTEQQGLATDHP